MPATVPIPGQDSPPLTPGPVQSVGGYRLDRLATWLGLGFFGLVLVYAGAVHFSNSVFPYDDGYIIYRYVNNLFAGHGLVYNPGERVFGVSTPLYLLWLVVLKAVARPAPVPALAVYANFVWYLAAGFGMLFLLRRLVRSPWLAALVSGLFLLRNGMLYVSTGGMESFMFLAFVCWAFWALAVRRWRIAGLLAGLSVLVRPEGIFLAGVVFVAWLFTGRPRPLGFLLGLIIPGLAWVVFGFAVYGTPVYNSLIAKARPVYPLPGGFAIDSIWGVVREWTSAGLFGRCRFLSLGLLLLAAAGIVLRHRLLKLRGNGGWPLLAFSGALLLFYWVANPLLFAWYYPVLEGLWFLLFATGLIWLGAWLGRRLTPLRWLPLLVCLFILAWPGFRSPSLRLARGRPLTHLGIPDDEVRMRTVGYRDAALWLNEVLPDGVPLAGPEIGSLGYHYKGPVIDACGLVSPEVIPFLPVPLEQRYHGKSGVIGREMVRSLAPDVIATMSVFANLSIYSDDWFNYNYVRVRQFPLPHELWGSKAVDVWFRRDHVTTGE